MTFSLILLTYVVFLPFINAALFEELEKKTGGNAADCTFLNQGQCAQAGACLWDDSTSKCAPDPCFEKTVTGQDACSKAAPAGKTCAKVSTDTITFCVTSDRVGDFTTKAAFCSLEWGDTKLVEETFCRAFSGCKTVTEISVSATTAYYVCNEQPPVVDDCNVLTEEICPYVGKCKWEGDKCIGDSCWEKTYSSADNCGSGCDEFTISGSGATELGYCKSAGKDLHDKCNAGTGTNALTKKLACTGYPSECNKIVTINNYEGGTLYVCSTAEGEFTVPDSDAAVALNSFTIAVSALILLVLFL